MRPPDFKTMSIDELLSLRDQLNETLSSRIETEQRELETRLARLRNAKLLDSEERFFPSFRTGRKLGKVPPKYRNPDNPSETWAGRGKLPRWIKAAVKSGKKISDFKISDRADAGSAKGRKIGR